MRKLLILCLLLSTMLLSATERYSLSALGVYGYSTPWLHHGGAALCAELPINEHFEMDVRGEALSSDVYTVGTSMRPKFPLPVGDMYIDASVLYRAIHRNRIHDVNYALSLGYRMDYVEVQVGVYNKLVGEMRMSWHDMDAWVNEPFNLLYKVRFGYLKQDAKWNLYGTISDFTEWQYERHWQLLFGIGGYYSFTEHHRMMVDVECKPAGMFHLDANFYGLTARLGYTYLF